MGSKQNSDGQRENPSLFQRLLKLTSLLIVTLLAITILYDSWQKKIVVEWSGFNKVAGDEVTKDEITIEVAKSLRTLIDIAGEASYFEVVVVRDDEKSDVLELPSPLMWTQNIADRIGNSLGRNAGVSIAVRCPEADCAKKIQAEILFPDPKIRSEQVPVIGNFDSDNAFGERIATRIFQRLDAFGYAMARNKDQATIEVFSALYPIVIQGESLRDEENRKLALRVFCRVARDSPSVFEKAHFTIGFPDRVDKIRSVCDM